MMRLVGLHSLRVFLFLVLSFLLIYQPVFTLPASRVIAATKAPARAQVIKHKHKADEVIVKFHQGAPQEQIDQIVNAFAKEKKELRGNKNAARLKLRDGYDVANTVFNLSQMNAVIQWAEPNYIVEGSSVSRKRKSQDNANPNDPGFQAQWALANTGQSNGAPGADIRAQAGWEKITGSRDTVVAVIDTGVDLTHPDLKKNLWVNKAEAKGRKKEDDDKNGYVDDVNGWNFVSDNENVADDNGHGTAMAGIIAAEAGNGIGIAGVMWKAGLLPLKALDSTGSGSISDVVEAIDYAAAHGASVVNCSFGTDAFSQALFDAINRASMAGVLVVASAGNNSRDLTGSPYYPASYSASNLISVAATTNTDQLAGFSNWGKEDVHVAAPGVDVLTTIPGGRYNIISGTSAAAPLVSGVAGLLKTIRGWVSAQTVRQSLILGARKVPALEDKVASGGVVSAGDAVAAFLNNNGNDPGNGGGNGGGNNGGGQGGGAGGSGGPIGQIPPGMLDFMRANRPKLPEPRVMINNAPNNPYDDPEPSIGGLGGYYAQGSLPQNSVGVAGRKPGEDPDPTDNGSATGQTSINLGSQNVNFTAPIVSLSGRAGLGVNLALSYNSNIWVKNGGSIAFNTDKDVAGVGWSIGFGSIEGIPSGASIETFWDSASARSAFLYISPDGARHTLAQIGATDVYASYDSSYIEFNKTSKVLRFMDGTQVSFITPTYQGVAVGKRMLPSQIKDRNGNFITIANAEIVNGNGVANNTHDWGIDYVTDTLGRKIDFYYEGNLLRKVRQDRGGGTYYDYVNIYYAPITISTNFTTGLTPDPININGTQVWQPWFVQYSTGHNHRLFYTSYGQMYLVEKWVPQVTGQGDGRPVAFTLYNMPSVGNYSAPGGASVTPDEAVQGDNVNPQQTDCPKFSIRQEWAENWSPASTQANPAPDIAGWNKVPSGSITHYFARYSYEFNAAPNYSTVTDPAGRIYRTDTSADGLTHTSKVYASAAAYSGGSGTPLKTITTTYTKDSGPAYTSNQRVATAQITDGSFTRKTAIGYDITTISGVALPNDITEYKADAATVYRHTVTAYNSDSAYASRHIYGLPFQVSVYAGAGTATLVSRTEYGYDDATEFINSSGDGVIQHDSANYGGYFAGRANQTLVRQYSVVSGAAGAYRDIRRTVYDSEGNVRQSKELNAAGSGYNIIEFDVSDNYSASTGVGQTHAFVKILKAPLSLWSVAEYDYFTGNTTKSYRLNGSTRENEVTYGYDGFGRLTSVTRPDSGGFTRAYWDNWIAVATYTKIISTTQTRYDFVAYDGAGHTRWNGGDHADAVAGKYSVKRFVYDNVGRTVQASHATETDGSIVATGDDAASGFLWEQIQYDALDRQDLITHPDSNTIDYAYNGCGCAGGQTITVRDERYRYRRMNYDFLGRLYESRELTSAQATYSRARYSYNELDQMTKIEHFNGDNDGGARQDRTFAYDGYARLQSETTPETGTTSYEYWSNDLPKKKTDARGIYATLSYDARKLLTDVDYSDSTRDVHYDYGAYGERTLMQEKNGATVVASTSYGYDSLKRLQSETRQFAGLGGSYSVNYSYNYADMLTQMSYSGPGWSRDVYYGYKSSGAPNNVGTSMAPGLPFSDNVMKNFSYRAFGALKAADYGNGRKIEVGYSYRQTLWSMKVSTGSDVIINNAYDYYGATGTNNGRVQKITDNVDANYTTTYEYDDFNRLEKAYSNNFYRDYDYDAWGNITKVTATGQREADTYTLAYAANGTGAPATNRIASVTYTWAGGGSSPAYAHYYDNAGNLTGDGNTGSAPNFSYDAANRLLSVNYGGSSYEYDGDGRRVKGVSGGVTTFQLWSSVLGQPVADLTASGTLYRAYVHSSSGQMLALQATDSNFYWTHTDHLGSGRKLTNTSGTVVYRAEFDPHGQTLMEWAQGGSSQYNLNSHKFTGYERDASNVDNANARAFYHNRGRFTQADPLGLGAADLTNPQSLNLYGYVGNDPMNFVDPSGLNQEIISYLDCYLTIHFEDGGSITYCKERIFIFGGGGGGQSGGGGEIDRGGGGGGKPQTPTKQNDLTAEDCAKIRKLLAREAAMGTMGASSKSTLGHGDGLLSTIKNGNLWTRFGRLDLEWYGTLTSVEGRALQTPLAAMMGGNFPLAVASVYGGAKHFWTGVRVAGNLAAKLSGSEVTMKVANPFAFTDSGERTAVRLAINPLNGWSTVFDEQFMKANCPP